MWQCKLHFTAPNWILKVTCMSYSLKVTSHFKILVSKSPIPGSLINLILLPPFLIKHPNLRLPVSSILPSYFWNHTCRCGLIQLWANVVRISQPSVPFLGLVEQHGGKNMAPQVSRLIDQGWEKLMWSLLGEFIVFSVCMYNILHMTCFVIYVVFTKYRWHASRSKRNEKKHQHFSALLTVFFKC